MSLFLGKRPPYNKRVQNGLELLILIRASYWMALWLGSMHLRAAYSNLSTFRTDLISRGICKFDLVSIILVEWRAQMFLSLWWPNAVIIATQFSVWSSTGRLSTATILSKVPNAQPMHSQCTANTLPLTKVLECTSGPCHEVASMRVWLALDCHWKVICFVLLLHLPALDCREKRIVIVGPNRRNPMLLDCHWKVICFVRARTRQRSLSTPMTLNNHHFMSTSPFSRIVILPSDFPASKWVRVSPQTMRRTEDNKRQDFFKEI